MRSIVWLFFAVFVLAAPLEADGDRYPNILILYADDLGFGDLRLQNRRSKIPTPNLDRLTQSGMRFTDGHSSASICTPSRYALLTGRHHWRDFHGIVRALGGSVFKPERLTLPEMLKQKGYNTACIGKWHLGWNWDALRKSPGEKGIAPGDFDWTRSIPDGPLAHGFDTYFGDTVINFPPYGWIENDRVVRAPDVMMDTNKWKKIKEGRWECRPGPMVSDWNPYDNIPPTTQRGVEFIKAQKNADRPFFLYFAFPSPHAPIIPNDVFDGKSGAGPYGDFVYETDDACGRLLKALEDSGQADNTVVVFSSDNGPEHYAYARDQKFDHWSAEPFRGLKRDLYEGGHHVPFVVRWPGVTKAGSVSDSLVSQIDLLATFAEALDFKLPDDAAEDSHSLLPTLRDPTQSVRSADVHCSHREDFAIRQGDWGLIVAGDGYVSPRNADWEAKRSYAPDDKDPVELYNLEADIGQRTNVAVRYPERVREMRSLLQTIREQGHSAPRLAR